MHLLFFKSNLYPSLNLPLKTKIDISLINLTSFKNFGYDFQIKRTFKNLLQGNLYLMNYAVLFGGVKHFKFKCLTGVLMG